MKEKKSYSWAGFKQYMKEARAYSLSDFKREMKQIGREFKEDMKEISVESQESEKRINNYLYGDKSAELTTYEKFVTIVLPKIFWVLAVLICIVIGIFGAIYWMILSVIIFIVIWRLL